MRVLDVVVAFTLVVSLSALAPYDEASSQPGEQSDSDGFVSLFDGKTLDGWHVVPRETAADWSVGDGAIVGHGGADRLSYLVWGDADLTDFELRLRYRLPGNGNTGIEIRARPDPTGKRPFEGYHADLGHVGMGKNILGAWDFHFAKRKEPPCPRGTRLVIDGQGGFDSSALPDPIARRDIRRRQWNDVRIVARGNHFQFFINGKLASEFTDNAEDGQLTHGAIGLQIHDKGMQVEFKDIRLKRLGTMVQSKERVPVGLQKQLLVDDYVIAEKQNVTRALGKPQKVGVVMKPSPDMPTDHHPDKPYPEWASEVPHDFGYRTTVLWNEHEEMFQMLYRASGEDVTAYAESEDGIHWTKPLISTAPNGKCNLITYRGKTKRTFYEASCMIDPTVPWGHAEKYKAAYNPGNTMCAIAYSADGIHWEGYNEGRSVTGRAADFHNQILWDPIARRYMLLTRMDLGTKGGKTEERAARIMAHEKGNDLLSYPRAWKTLATIAVDDPKGEETPADVKVLQMESMTIWIYENVYFGLMHVLTLGEMTGASQDEIKVANPDKRPETDVVDFYIGTSRDGVHFDKSWVYERKPFIERGGDGCFDKAMVHAASEIVTRGDEHWIYYAGIYQEHHSGFTSKKSGKIGLATLPLDRFIGQQAGGTLGTIVTKPFRLEGDRLEVNVDAHAGWVQVEILDEDGRPIPAFSGKDARAYQAVDDLRLRPAWNSKSDLSSLKGEVIRIRFRLRNARLYAFQINRESGGKYAARPRTTPQGKDEVMVSGKHALTVRKRVDFNAGWRFIKEDVAGAEKDDFDDGDWRKLDLPHDWSIEGPFRAEFASGTGYLPGGIGWYRKTFRLSDAFQGRQVRIEFDGVYNHSEVWCNGISLGKRPYGYASFGYDLTPHLKAGDAPNVIAVRVDHSDYADSRWYTGSGIYRNVHLVLTKEIYVKRHGIFVATPHVAEDRANVEIRTTLVNRSEADRDVVLVNSVFGHDGELLATVENDLRLSMGGEIEITQSVDISNPLLWSPDHPDLYELYTEIKTENESLDDDCTSFGIRYFDFHPDEGFSLNGAPMKLKGLCIHHDAGALGAAVPIQVWERRLRILKELGCNAIRMSHNPPASNLLDLCDAMGFLVMDEAFDEWDGCKRKWVEGWNKGIPSLKGYGAHFKEWSESDLREMLLRDRNHPSIILWSIGNEVDYPYDPFPPNEDALAPMAERLVAIVKSLDTSRPVTAGLASPETNLFADCLDVVGYNYHEDLYEKDHSRYPGRVIYGSENGKGLKAWLAMEKNDFIAGLHLWTGIDFLGEAGSWPWRNSGTGLLDLAGFKKSAAFFWQSLWTDTPMVQLFLRQGKGTEAKSTMVCYTNCDSVELLRDRESLGEKRLSDSPNRVLPWQVPSEEGVFSALGRRQGEVVCSAEWQAPGEPDRFLLTQDKETLLGNGRDVAHIEVRIVDSNGIRVEDAQHEITCEIKGPARLIGMESGDAQSHEAYQSNRRKAFRGRLLLFVQSGREPGDVEVALSTEGLPQANVHLKVEKKGDQS